MDRKTKIAMVMLLSAAMSGCGAFINKEDNVRWHEHHECASTEHSSVRNMKVLFFGIYDEKEMECIKQKEDFEKSPEGKALAEKKRIDELNKQNDIKQRKALDKEFAERRCREIGLDLAGRKGAVLDDISLRHMSDYSQQFSCFTTVSIGFDSRSYIITSDLSSGDYQYRLYTINQ